MGIKEGITRRDAVVGFSGLSVATMMGWMTMSNAHAQDAGATPTSAEEAVGTVMMQFAIGFATRDAAATAACYTEDAEWLNAFGDRVVGRAAIQAKLEELFRAEEFLEGEIVGEPDGSVRLLTADTAVGWTYQEIKDQQVVDSDTVIPLRKNHSLAVLVNSGDGWLISAHMFMDENPKA